MDTKCTQRDRMQHGQGFVAALDQSGGSTPKALALYGISQDQYAGEEAMFDLVHQMRTRIITSPSFSSKHILAAILFEQTMDREIEGKPTAQYLWEEKGIVPILKVDQGLAEESNGVQCMRPIHGLAQLLDRANEKGIFGTKMRSVIHAPNQQGIQELVDQQFRIAEEILAKGLVPIIEPEVSIQKPDREKSEQILLDCLLAALDKLPEGQEVMLKLSIPVQADFYRPLIQHPRVLRCLALSGGYSREEANRELQKNPGLIASFSRALAEGLSAQQSDEAFNETLAWSIQSIYEASIA